MSTFNAFEMSPVPAPSEDAQPPEPFRGIYGMPMFVTVPTSDLDASVDFWTEALGFFTLFSIPGQLVHLRRWAFQDVLLVPTPQAPAPADGPSVSVSFSCVLSQIDEIAEACEQRRPAASPARAPPRGTPARSRSSPPRAYTSSSPPPGPWTRTVRRPRASGASASRLPRPDRSGLALHEWCIHHQAPPLSPSGRDSTPPRRMSPSGGRRPASGRRVEARA